jgi:hypothetical protein
MKIERSGQKKNSFLLLFFLNLFLLFIFFSNLKSQEILLKVDVAVVPKILSRGESGPDYPEAHGA